MRGGVSCGWLFCSPAAPAGHKSCGVGAVALSHKVTPAWACCLPGGYCFAGAQVTAVGEMMLEVGAPHGWGPTRLNSQQLERVLSALHHTADNGNADATVLRQGSTEVAAEGGARQPAGEGSTSSDSSLAVCCCNTQGRGDQYRCS